MDIDKIAKIARLKLSIEEKKKFERELEQILEYFKELDKIKEDKKFSIHPFEIKNVFDCDEIEPSLTENEALSNVKNKDIGYFKSPRCI